MLRRLTDDLPLLPEVGDAFAGFRLIGELGRGAFGRVYLARQGDLADRPVALKVSTGCFAESQKLARLQHTHIVPVYSFHRAGPLQAVCMPYFGSTTLADVLDDLGQRQTLPASGKGLVSTLNSHRGKSGPFPTAKPGAPVAPSHPKPASREPPCNQELTNLESVSGSAPAARTRHRSAGPDASPAPYRGSDRPCDDRPSLSGSSSDAASFAAILLRRSSPRSW